MGYGEGMTTQEAFRLLTVMHLAMPNIKRMCTSNREPFPWGGMRTCVSRHRAKGKWTAWHHPYWFQSKAWQAAQMRIGRSVPADRRFLASRNMNQCGLPLARPMFWAMRREHFARVSR